MKKIKKAKTEPASLSMIEYLERRDLPPISVQEMAKKLEEFDPGAKKSHEMAKKYYKEKKK